MFNVEVEGDYRPILKWAGGKRQILNYLLANSPPSFDTYYEPFVGGGALLIALYSLGRIKRAIISDINPDIINLYNIIKNAPYELIEELENIKYKNKVADYYEARNEFNLMVFSIRRAALLIYLNRHGYNGLYRVNSSGKFNVPFGSYSNPMLPQTRQILRLNEILRNCEILDVDFEKAVSSANKGDFVYFDPPYMPLNSSSYFTDYSSAGFTKEDQVRLFNTFSRLSEKGVLVMESNSDTDFIEKMYSKFNIIKIKAKRNINSVASKRGPINELVIRNYVSDITSLT